MSLPERAVDMWVACAISERFPGAEIWAPTQNDRPGNWDLATQVAGSKTVILENKATVPNLGGTHRIAISKAQLDRYWWNLDPALFGRLFYILPSPPWCGGPAARPVPRQANTRTSPPLANFKDWAYVLPAHCLRLWLRVQAKSSVNSAQLPTAITSPLVCPTCGRIPWSLREFLDGLAKCCIVERTGATTRGAPDTGPPENQMHWDAAAAEQHRLDERERLEVKDDASKVPVHDIADSPAKDGGAVTPLVTTIPATDLNQP